MRCARQRSKAGRQVHGRGDRLQVRGRAQTAVVRPDSSKERRGAMASIAKRPDGTYRPRYRDENGKEHSRHFKRKVDAQRWLDEVTAAMVTGDYVDPSAGKVSFKAWFAEWSGRQVWERGTLLAAQQAA